MRDNEAPPLVDEVRLGMVSGVGPRIRQGLMAAFGDASAALSASPAELQRVDGIGPKLAKRIASARSEIDAESELTAAAESGVRVLTQQDPAYPRGLREIHDPPGVLYASGSVVPEDGIAVAIVGTRHATRYGLKQAERFADGLARRGVTVVSGLARGIDGAAHRAALSAGGRTIAVLASGVLKVYPPEHEKLAGEIADNGAVVSEAAPRMPPIGGAFPQRNRIISGLSLGVLVVEAADRSGALITARHAADQGREVFALPGPVDSRLSRGCHSLIRDGAALVSDVDELLGELGPLFEGVTRPDGGETRSVAELSLNEVESRVLGAISESPTEMDTIVEQAGLPVHRVLATVSVLEMRRLVRRVSGSLVARV